MDNKMMKKCVMTCVVGLMAAAGAHAQRIVFEKDVVDAGATLWRHPVTAVFQFSNKGREPLVVNDVDAGCGCMATEWTKDAVVKGGKGEIRVTYDAQLLGHLDRYIDVYTNAGSQPVRLRMKARVHDGAKQSVEDLFPYAVDDIRLSTSDVEFPEVQSGDSAVAEIEVLNGGKDVYTPTLMHLPAYITAEYKPAMIARGRRGKIRLTLHSDKLQNLGLNQTSVYLARFSGDKVSANNEVSVSAVLLPDLQSAAGFAKKPKFALSSTELNLGVLGKKKKVSGMVTISNGGNGVLKFNKIQAFNQAISVTLKKTELQPGEKVDMKVTVDARFLGMSKAQPRVLIITNDPAAPKAVVSVRFEK